MNDLITRLVTDQNEINKTLYGEDWMSNRTLFSSKGISICAKIMNEYEKSFSISAKKEIFMDLSIQLFQALVSINLQILTGGPLHNEIMQNDNVARLSQAASGRFMNPDILPFDSTIDVINAIISSILIKDRSYPVTYFKELVVSLELDLEEVLNAVDQINHPDTINFIGLEIGLSI